MILRLLAAAAAVGAALRLRPSSSASHAAVPGVCRRYNPIDVVVIGIKKRGERKSLVSFALIRLQPQLTTTPSTRSKG